MDENSATFRAGLKQVIDRGKKNLLGVLVDAVDYEAAVERIIDAAHAGRPLAASALAVHGVMTGVQDRTHRYRLNHLDMVTPDGQPVRWALNALHGTGLTERVYGPTLTLKLCERAQREGLAIYLYGSQIHVLQALALRLKCLFPRLIVAGWEPSRFRSLSAEEAQEADSRIRASGARITLVGLGCPRQEVWVYEHREALSMPTLAVGAAFDFHAGRLPQAPMLLQRIGLEWAYRLVREPRRLWRRYVILNPKFLWLLTLQLTRARGFDPADVVKPAAELRYG